MNGDTWKVLALAVVAAMITMGCTCPLLSSVARPAAVTRTPTKTPRPPATATSTATPTVETQPSPTAPPTPMETPTVVDAQGRALSEAVLFQTDSEDCDADGTGRQWVIIDFKRDY